MKRLLKQFSLNLKNVDTSLIDNLFDFVIIGLVAIVFASFGSSLVAHNLTNIIFSIANVILISTTWYTYTFYSLRYQNKTTFHVIVMVLVLITLIIYGVGVKALFISDSLYSNHFLILGFVLSRSFIALIFILVDISNKNAEVSAFVRWKYWSRLVNVVLILLNAQFGFMNLKILFVLLALIEMVGNVVQITGKHFNKLPQIDANYSKQRFTKLNSLYIGSFLVASINFYSGYVQKFHFNYLITHLIIFVILGVLLWVVYNQRITRFTLQDSALTIVLFASFSIFIDIGSSIIGSVFLHLEGFANLDARIPLVGMILIIIGLWSFLYSAVFPPKRKKFKRYKIIEYSVYMLILGLFVILNIPNLYVSLTIITLIFIALIWVDLVFKNLTNNKK